MRIRKDTSIFMTDFKKIQIQSNIYIISNFNQHQQFGVMEAAALFAVTFET